MTKKDLELLKKYNKIDGFNYTVIKSYLQQIEQLKFLLKQQSNRYQDILKELKCQEES